MFMGGSAVPVRMWRRLMCPCVARGNRTFTTLKRLPNNIPLCQQPITNPPAHNINTVYTPKITHANKVLSHNGTSRGLQTLTGVQNDRTLNNSTRNDVQCTGQFTRHLHGKTRRQLESPNKSPVRHMNTTNTGLVVQEITTRGLIQLEGADVFTFLQGLVTNDVSHLQGHERALYTLLLNVQGRVLYDMLLYNTNSRDEPSLLLECDTEVLSELMSVLKRYKIRRKVKLSDLSAEYRLWAVLPTDVTAPPLAPEVGSRGDVVFCGKDPRVTMLGHRVITKADVKNTFLQNASAAPDAEFYRRRRYQLGIGEGVQELPPGNCFPLESNAVFLNGVSFNKGCYIGQELTARTYHTGVTRKRIMPINFSVEDGVSPEDQVKSLSGKSGGKLRGVVGGASGGVGLGLLRLANVLNKTAPHPELVFTDSSGKETGRGVTAVPPWWHTEHDEYLRSVLGLPALIQDS